MGDTTDGSSRAAQGAQSVTGDEGAKPLSIFNRLFGKDTGQDQPTVPFGTPEDMAAASREAQAMILNVRRMRDIRIRDVAVPRADITALADTAELDEVVQVFRDSGYTRLPVYSETLDTPLGFVHLKDVALGHGFNCDEDSFDLPGILRPLLFAPPSMSMGVLLQKMQSDRIHMALVIDEYGGVDGLVTIEDLVEQIVGEIADEHDVEEDDLWIEEKKGVYLCQARAPLDEFEQAAGVDLLPDDLDEDVETLGGLVFMLAGRVPLRGEVVPDDFGNEFEVVEADPRRLKRLRVRLAGSTALDKAAE